MLQGHDIKLKPSYKEGCFDIGGNVSPLLLSGETWNKKLRFELEMKV
jgi:hypothetical protein